jgi:hypothetical protein
LSCIEFSASRSSDLQQSIDCVLQFVEIDRLDELRGKSARL